MPAASVVTVVIMFAPSASAREVLNEPLVTVTIVPFNFTVTAVESFTVPLTVTDVKLVIRLSLGDVRLTIGGFESRVTFRTTVELPPVASVAIKLMELLPSAKDTFPLTIPVVLTVISEPPVPLGFALTVMGVVPVTVPTTDTGDVFVINPSAGWEILRTGIVVPACPVISIVK